MMIEIDLNLFATLSCYASRDDTRYAVPEKTTIETLVRDLKIPEGEVKLIFVNGRKQTLSYQLENKDRVGLFPPVGGG